MKFILYTLFFLLPYVSSAQKVNMHAEIGFIFEANFSKLVQLDLDAFEGRRKHIAGKEYHWIQRVNFSKKALIKYIQRAYLITDNGTFNLTYKSTKVIKETNVEGGDDQFELYYDMKFISDKKIEFSKVAFMSFHKFELDNVVLFDINSGFKNELDIDPIVSKSWMPCSVSANSCLARFIKRVTGGYSLESGYKAEGKAEPTTVESYNLLASNCKKYVFDITLFYQCKETGFVLYGTELISRDMHGTGAPVFAPLFYANINRKKHLFIQTGIQSYVFDNGRWHISDEIQGWYSNWGK